MDTTLTMAVLFADVSGSSRLYERLGNRVALVLIEKCLNAMQEVVARYRGRVVKTIGDEIMAVFDDPVIACRAAMDMHLGICTLPEAIEHGLTIHCGLHFGEVMVENADVFGDTVNVAARLAVVSKSGQIVTSGEVIRVLPPELASATRFLDSEPVRGRTAPVELFEVLWEPDVELTADSGRRAWARPSLKIAMVLRYRGREYRVDELHPTISLGRDIRADIVLDDKHASRNHCRIGKTRDRFTFLDFSSNGSYVKTAGHEEVPVRRESIVLQDSGTISFGRPVEIKPDAAVAFEIQVRS